jgi:hypothetical protein
MRDMTFASMTTSEPPQLYGVGSRLQVERRSQTRRYGEFESPYHIDSETNIMERRCLLLPPHPAALVLHKRLQ